MFLKPQLRRSLKLANNVNVINDQTYNKLLEMCFGELLDMQRSNVASLNHSKPDVIKEVYAALLTCIAECGRNNLNSDTVNKMLTQEGGFLTNRAKLFSDLYDKHKLKLEIKLGNIGTHLPHIVDVNWKIDYVIKTSALDQSEGPIFRVTLITEQYDNTSEGKRLENINFSCNSQELQDLVYKLKDVVRHCQKIGSEH